MHIAKLTSRARHEHPQRNIMKPARAKGASPSGYGVTLKRKVYFRAE